MKQQKPQWTNLSSGFFASSTCVVQLRTDLEVQGARTPRHNEQVQIQMILGSK